MSGPGIDYFNRGHWLSRIQEKVSLNARRRMYDLWKPIGPQKVLDVGTTPDLERTDSNCILTWLLEDKHLVSALSPEDISELKMKFPSLQILPPFIGNEWCVPENSFQWVFSSAVLEHVGSFQDQTNFLKRCSFVADGIFLTTPNRWHWLEFHTKLPFLHWLPRPFHRAILNVLGKNFWAQEKNLNLLSKRELTRIAQATLSEKFEFDLRTVWSLGLPSNLVLIARKKAQT